MISFLKICCLFLLWNLFPAFAFAQDRHIDIIIDTSGSMNGTDQPRYTQQISQLLADLLSSGDSLSVISLPESQNSCSDGKNPDLLLKLDIAKRGDFQNALTSRLIYKHSNNFAAPVHTAKDDLEQHANKSRLLLFIGDSGGLKPCDNELNQELIELKNNGVMIAAINIGVLGTFDNNHPAPSCMSVCHVVEGAGAFDNNPAFSFATGAISSEALIKSIAEVYQKFIGTKQVQTGRVQGIIDVDIAPSTKQAFLVVAADGEIPTIEELKSNPSAKSKDLNYRGGGNTTGLDSITRHYKIVRLQTPQAGHWQFQIPSLSAKAGWLLLQESSLGLRLKSPPKQAKDIAVPIEVELYDEDTGKPVTDANKIPNLKTSLIVDGHEVTLEDNGTDGDKKAGDGIFSAPLKFNKEGKQNVILKLITNTLDKLTNTEIDVEKVAWTLNPQLPDKVEVQTAVPLKVQVTATNQNLTATPLQAIEVKTNGKTIATLKNQGNNLFSGNWQPSTIGNYTLDFIPIGGSGGLTVTNIPLNVIGSIKFGTAIPVKFPQTTSNTELPNKLDLSNATIKGEFNLGLSSNYDFQGSLLEIDLGQGWIPLNTKTATITLRQNAANSFPLRLRVVDCPSAVDANTPLNISITGIDANGKTISLTAPLSIEIIADPWLHCWWPVLAAILAAILIAFIIYGFISPSRFSARLGLVLSPEQDMNEGFFHPIKAQPATSSGFYRDAHVHIFEDFHLSGKGKGKGSFATLRASGKQVYIRPAIGASVYKLNLEDEWEELPVTESRANFGIIYKNALGTLFFEIRNG